MQTMEVAMCFGPLSLSTLLLISITSVPTLHAQAPAAGASVPVKMMEAIDSSKDPAGKQYRASVTHAVNAGNGVTIQQGATAAVTLVNSGNGSGWTTHLVAVTLNGQPVAVSSGPASVNGGMLTTASSAMNSMGSMLGGFGHHVKPTGITAVATGQRVLLPPGATLTFVLGQPPATASPAPSAVATSGAPTPQPAATSGSEVTAFYCLTALTAQNIIYYSPIEHRGQASTQGEIENAFGAFLRKTYGIGVSTTCTEMSSSTPEADRQQKIDDYRTRYKVVETSWVYTPAGGPIVAPSTAVSTGGPFISCSTTAGPGVDTYFTGIFQTTRPIKRMPNGWVFVDQSILDDFHAYLRQKGYNFKPGKNSGCDVKPTEEQTKAAKHTRAYGGGGGLGVNCCGNGKVVETGWKE